MNDHEGGDPMNARQRARVSLRWVGLQRFATRDVWLEKRRTPDADAMTAAERRAVLAAVAAGADWEAATAAATGVPESWLRELMDDVMASRRIDRAAGAVWFWRHDVRRSAAIDLPADLVGLIYTNDEWPGIYNCRECFASPGRHHEGCGLAPLHAALAETHRLRQALARCTCGAGGGSMVGAEVGR